MDAREELRHLRGVRSLDRNRDRSGKLVVEKPSSTARSAALSAFGHRLFAGKLVSLISRDMTLEPGDVIACGSSVGVVR